jgi:hypothetical protein
MTGLYTLKTPYSSLILSTTQYTCIAIQSLSGAISSNTDPFTNVYQANGATQSEFDLDLKNDAYLITISSGDGDLVVFPSSALVSVPITDGVIYRNLVLSLSLSAISDEADLTVFQQQMKDLALHSLGINSSVYITQVGAMTVLTRTNSDALEAARLVNAITPESELYNNHVLTQQNTALLQKVASLEAYIAKHFAQISI